MKNYVITGSVGHISKPIIEGLVKAGKSVTVISSNESKKSEIESLGATAAVGSVMDGNFLKRVFSNADIVYTMIPPIWQTTDWRASQNAIAKNYYEALKSSPVQYVVNLSSVGAHLENGVGPVSGLYDFEALLNFLEGKNIRHLRPSFFYYNFLAQVGLAKHQGILVANYGGADEKIFLVHTNDIAKAAIEELLALNFTGKSVRYVWGDEVSGDEIARTLGQAIGKDLKWIVVSDEEQRQGLLQAGLPETHANGYTEMGKALRTGIMQEDARRNKPQLATTKLNDFAKEFAEVYKRS